jgi:carboxymethylenebutenolidase
MNADSPQVPPQAYELFDRYVHGGLSRREFLERAGRLALGGLSAAALLETLSPNYALAQQVPEDDPRISVERTRYESKEGYGTVKALLARPKKLPAATIPGVLVVHENRGLNPYIEDVARRLASEGFLALAPDGLSSVGGYPGTDDEGRALQKKLDKEKLVRDFQAGVKHLGGHSLCTGKVGVVGFCFGGYVSNELAARIPSLGAAVPFYGSPPRLDRVTRIKAPLLIHFAENDKRVNAAWPEYKSALEAAGVSFAAHRYKGTKHGFHNDTTPRFDKAAAALAWKRTLAFFREKLG